LFCHIASGEVCWISRNDPHLLRAGDMLVISPAVKGVLRASQLTPVVVNYFRFCPDLLVGFLTLGERTRLNRAADTRYSRARVFRREDRLAKEFSELCARPGDKSQLAVRCKLLELAGAALLQHQTKAAFYRLAFLSASKRVHELLNHLSETELLDYTALELADRCGCSLRHLGKLFRGFFGVSLRTKQRELRLIKARHLLRESKMSVVDVAIAAGFPKQGGFSMAFKKQFGITPSQWRRRNGSSEKALEPRPHPQVS
jgi:AraC-like DNA-binding protein